VGVCVRGEVLPRVLRELPAAESPEGRAWAAFFARIGETIPPGSLVFADPYTGFQYAYPLDGIDVYFPVINPDFGANPNAWDAIAAYATGDAPTMLGTWCHAGGQRPARFFVDFGSPFSTHLERFSDFAALRDPVLLRTYVDAGAFVPVAGFPSSQDAPFVLYRLAC